MIGNMRRSVVVLLAAAVSLLASSSARNLGDFDDGSAVTHDGGSDWTLPDLPRCADEGFPEAEDFRQLWATFVNEDEGRQEGKI